MDRVEKPSPIRKSEFANEGDVNQRQAAELASPTGREDHLGLTEAGATAASEINKPISARPRSEVTGRHDAGSQANETVDGLSALEEALRHAAEDTPSGADSSLTDDVPVFDRAGAPPKI
jgi:hypothetical protein